MTLECSQPVATGAGTVSASRSLASALPAVAMGASVVVSTPGLKPGSSARSRTPLEEALQDRLIYSVFQPIVDLHTHQTFAHESLARCRMPALASPLALFEAAIAEKKVGEVGRILRISSVDGCTTHPLFMNVNPNEFDEGWLVRPDDPFFWHDHQVYLEVTESVPLSHFDLCRSVMAEMRAKGVRIVIDDLGAGFSNLKYISDLTPNVVKLDRELIAGLRIGSRLHRLVCSIVQLCHDMGATVVAEGIETIEELQAVIDAGADYGQGYLLARPATPPPIAVWPAGM